jgi:hypothetical protein
MRANTLSTPVLVAHIYFARFQVTVPTPPLDAVGVMYLSSSLLPEESKRFCSVPFQLGNVALSTLNMSILSTGLTEYVPIMAMLFDTTAPFSSGVPPARLFEANLGRSGPMIVSMK